MAGAIEAAVALMSIENSLVPPTINLENADPDCDLNYVPNTAIEGVEVNAAMSNSFGFGGHNACILFKKYKG